MLRGRHRGLPVAIDRAILVPTEFRKTGEDENSTSSHSPGCEHAQTLEAGQVRQEEKQHFSCS